MDRRGRGGGPLKTFGRDADWSIMTHSPAMYSDPVLEMARRGVVRLAIGGGLVLVLAATLQTFAGEPGGVVTLAGALPVTIVALLVGRQERPNVIALLALIVLIAVGAEGYAAATSATEYVAGVGGEVVVFGLGLLAVFIAREQARWVAVGFLSAALVIVVIAQIELNGLSWEIASDVLAVLAVLGTVMYFVIRVRDSLAESQSRYSDLASVIPVATFEFDVAGVMARLRAMRRNAPGSQALDEAYGELLSMVRLSYTNETADAMSGAFGPWGEFLVGPNVLNVRQVASSMLNALWVGQAGGSGEITFVTVDGSARDFFYQWGLGRVEGQSVPDRLVLAATDVTRLRYAERALERQLRERDQFVASVSHELRTPLTVIMGLTEELVDRPEDFGQTEQAELLEIVAAETRDVVDIVEDLLVTARAEAGQLAINVESCDLGLEATRIVESLGDVAADVESVWTHADPGRLRQVLRNLISNAHRHGGDHVRIVVGRQGGHAVAEVRDTGQPLPLSAQERIFEPYQRAGKGGVVGSVGLGLHVARLLARLMGGDLTYGHDGYETVFRLELPVSDEQLNVGTGGEVEESRGSSDVAAVDQI